MKLVSLITIAGSTAYASTGCNIYLAPSTVPGVGRGIFAGRDFDKNEVIERSPSLSFQQFPLYSTQLNNYVYASEHDLYVIASFGSAMVTLIVSHSLLDRLKSLL